MLLRYVGEADIREVRLSDLGEVDQNDDELMVWAKNGMLEVDDELAEQIIARTTRSEWQILTPSEPPETPEEAVPTADHSDDSGVVDPSMMAAASASSAKAKGKGARAPEEA